MTPETRTLLKQAVDRRVREREDLPPRPAGPEFGHGTGARWCKSCSCGYCRHYRARLKRVSRNSRRRRERLAA